jgi:hypothetical protein
MLDTERGLLMVEQERLRNTVRELKASIQKVGLAYSELGDRLRHSHPEWVRFHHLPADLDDNSIPNNLPCIDWDVVADLRGVMGQVISLRQCLKRLAEIQEALDAI